MKKKDNAMEALYMSDFLIKNKNTLNTLCLFFDRIFLHDYFGVFSNIYRKQEYERMQTSKDEQMIRFLWDIATRLDNKTKSFLKSLDYENEFEAYVLKGVLQGLCCETGRFSPSFVLRFAKEYGEFLRENHELIHEGVLVMCHKSTNPFLMAVSELEMDMTCSNEESDESLRQARLNNKRGCIFEQECHELPLISDTDEDLVLWKVSTDFLNTALSMAAIPAIVPTIGQAPAQMILEAREKLKDPLSLFRKVILDAAWQVSETVKESSIHEVKRLGRSLYETKIKPAMGEFESKLESDDTKLMQKLLGNGIDKTLLVARAFKPTDSHSKWELIAPGIKALRGIEIGKRMTPNFIDESEPINIPDALKDLEEALNAFAEAVTSVPKVQIVSPYEFVISVPKVS